tara:strand:+ start:287 stop:424 length:138 start_codon:yes stop_codon:yes gene_type:complete
LLRTWNQLDALGEGDPRCVRESAVFVYIVIAEAFCCGGGAVSQLA